RIVRAPGRNPGAPFLRVVPPARAVPPDRATVSCREDAPTTWRCPMAFQQTYPELTGRYTVDPAHTRIGFVSRHAMVTKVRGSFAEFTGTAVLDGEDPSRSSVEIVIQASSIDTRNADRDGHLRSNDFLQMEDYPE